MGVGGRGLGTSTTLHARHLLGSLEVFEPLSRSRRSGCLLLGLLLPGLQRAREERLPAAEAQRVPVDRARFREIDQHHVEQALGLKARVIRPGQHEATTANLVGVFAVGSSGISVAR